MNTNPSPSEPLFRDQPLPNPGRATLRRSPLLLACEDRPDYLDTALRVFLMLCLMVSLLMCGLSLSNPPKAVGTLSAVEAAPSPESIARAPRPS